ncbi:MAG: Serine/threonine protein kinaserelated protein [Planctomycetaceae bacterium]|nr:Serine/threonine protein kinaserelated protein [Planctomycetaceae bacterium]
MPSPDFAKTSTNDSAQTLASNEAQPPNRRPSDGTWVQSNEESERSRLLSARRDHPPANVPGYEIQRCLGEGAYGSVWLAMELGTGKLVAIKFYTQRRGLDWSLLNREVEKLAVLYTCRNIVGLIDVGWDADPPHYVMEYLENGSLANLLAHGPVSVHEAVRLGRDVLKGLVQAHGSGILHCDLKPANILLDKNNEARLADFGQSRLSYEQHHALGTLFYMAPEQADVNAIPGAGWDVYAWGAVLYQALTGQPPHRTPETENLLADSQAAESRLETYRQILNSGIKPRNHWRVRGVDRRLAEIIDRCLETDPGQRYPNAQAVLGALEARERHLANRPWLMLGIVGPVVLLLAIGSLARYAMSAAVRSAQENLLDRALESDVVTVKILARSIERELEDRTGELRKVAEDSRLNQAIHNEATLPWEQRTRLRAVLGEWKKLVDEDREQQGLDVDTSWFVTDARGKQIYRDPYNTETVDREWRDRDYFHGKGREYAHGQIPADVGPIQKPHISMAYKSDADGFYRIAITVPIYSATRDQVIGVLGRSISLPKILAAYKPQLQADAGEKQQIERTIALFDRHSPNDGRHSEAARAEEAVSHQPGRPRFELLDHPWLTEERLLQQREEPLEVDAHHAKQLAKLQELVHAKKSEQPSGELSEFDQSANYTDPVGQIDKDAYGGVWLAAFWPVAHTDWIAVVQERQSTAQHPVVEMEHRLSRYMYFGLLICCGLIGALWYFIFRVLSDRERAANA